jgi:hypothetical protein
VTQRAASSRQPTRLPMRSSNGCFGLRIQPIDVTCRVVVRLLPILGQSVCERDATACTCGHPLDVSGVLRGERVCSVDCTRS